MEGDSGSGSSSGGGPARLLDHDSASNTDTSQAQDNPAFDAAGSLKDISDGSCRKDDPAASSDGASQPGTSPAPGLAGALKDTSDVLHCQGEGVLAEEKVEAGEERSSACHTPSHDGRDPSPAAEDKGKAAARHHSRASSQLSSSDASLSAASEPEVGCGGEGDGCTASPTLHRRGVEYSEAATLPLGCPSVEEKINEWNGRSEKFTEDKKSWRLDECCRCILQANHLLPEHPTTSQRVQHALTCPPHGKVGDALLWLVVGAAAWGCLISITGSQALPGGNLFSLAVLYLAAVWAGRAAAALAMPPLLGSLVAGILFESVPGINAVGHNVDVYWSAVIRNLVLVIILIRAGLGLDPAALRKLSCVVLRLAFLPCLVEAVVAGLMAKLLLGLPWLWAFMLGFVVAAVSPAVVVPGLLKLAEEGYGVEAGIPTLVIAAASLDDVLAITGFSVMLGLAFAEGSLAWTLAKGPLEVVAGLVYGAVFGALCWLLPHQDTKNRPVFKFIILFCLGALGMFGSHKVGLESSGPIAVLSLAFVTGLGWRRSENKDPEVSKYYRVLWEVFQPALFVLIGAEIDVGRIDAGTIGWGLLALLVCLSMRVGTSFLVVMGAGFTLLERLFIAIAWLPKATVQAAIGSQALDYVRQNQNNAEDVFRGQQVVTIAVMVILVTAPIGAAAIKLTGPRFLARQQHSDSQA